VRRLCYGGSFNPIHHGHLICSRAVAEAAGYEQVVLVPSAQPPHKLKNADVAAAEHRLRMCELAITGLGWAVDDLELRRTGPSYTIDTARALKGQGWNEVHWLIGADTLPQLPTWHDASSLLAEVTFIIMARPGWMIDWANLPDVLQHLRSNVIQAPQIDISATTLRQRVRQGQSIQYLTPQPVCDYIEAEKLYR
jgi:nicotinate-nucleotide adenylyltransferase